MWGLIIGSLRCFTHFTCITVDIQFISQNLLAMKLVIRQLKSQLYKRVRMDLERFYKFFTVFPRVM